jgi:hypothetical protein
MGSPGRGSASRKTFQFTRRIEKSEKRGNGGTGRFLFDVILRIGRIDEGCLSCRAKWSCVEISTKGRLQDPGLALEELLEYADWERAGWQDWLAKRGDQVLKSNSG